MSSAAVLDMNISQFLKSLGLEQLRDIFEREQVRDAACTKMLSQPDMISFVSSSDSHISKYLNRS